MSIEALFLHIPANLELTVFVLCWNEILHLCSLQNDSLNQQGDKNLEENSCSSYLTQIQHS